MKKLGVVGVLLVAGAASADPIAWSPPEKCPDGFTCGALAARLAGHDGDWPAAFVAQKRACAFDTFFCPDLAQLHVSAGPKRGGDPAKGIAMLEAFCKAAPADNRSPCTTLARDYDEPPKESGLARDAAKAEAIYSKECDGGDYLTCSTLGRMHLKAGDIVRARASMEKGCAGNDHYAAGVCSTIATELVKGTFGTPDAKGAIPYLERSCPRGYRCDLGVQLLTNGKDMPRDIERAKKMAHFGCENFYCEGIDIVGKWDPAWAAAEHAARAAKNTKAREGSRRQ